MKLIKSSVQSVPSAKMVYKGYNKHCPDPTLSHNGLEYDTSLAHIKAMFYNERLAERTNKHETLNQYDAELNHFANYVPHREHNKQLEHARSEKVERHRTLLPQLLY